jgi:glucan-binding YG repeat protein
VEKKLDPRIQKGGPPKEAERSRKKQKEAKRSKKKQKEAKRCKKKEIEASVSSWKTLRPPSSVRILEQRRKENFRTQSYRNLGVSLEQPAMEKRYNHFIECAYAVVRDKDRDGDRDGE